MLTTHSFSTIILKFHMSGLCVLCLCTVAICFRWLKGNAESNMNSNRITFAMYVWEAKLEWRRRRNEPLFVGFVDGRAIHMLYAQVNNANMKRLACKRDSIFHLFFFFQLLIEVEFHDIDDWFIHKFSSFTTRNRDNELYEQIKCLITYVRKYTVLVY